MKKFVGAFFLLSGLAMLMNYQAVVQMVMAEGATARAMVPYLHDYLLMAVGYTWPVVATLIGLSYLFCFKKCWATKLIYIYMLIFVLGHMWAGNLVGATWALAVALFVAVTKVASSVGGMMCTMEGMNGKKK
ncbi:MAG: hypothetical protein AB7J40_05980 [Candidatus Altimarinota bacterium]